MNDTPEIKPSPLYQRDLVWYSKRFGLLRGEWSAYDWEETRPIYHNHSKHFITSRSEGKKQIDELFETLLQ